MPGNQAVIIIWEGGGNLPRAPCLGQSGEHACVPSSVGMCPGQGAVLWEWGREAGPRQRWALVHGLLYED